MFYEKIKKLYRPKVSLPILLFISACLHTVYLIQLQHTPYASILMVDAEGYHLKALKLLKDGWLGNGAFFQAPLYPYFLAIIYKVFGVSFIAVQTIQAVISLTNIALIYLLGKNLFDEKTGLVSAVLAVFYSPLVYYSGLLLKVTLSLFFSCLLLLVLIRTTRSATAWTYLLAGLYLGINITLRGNFLLLFPVLVLWILCTHSKNLRTKGAVLFILGTCLALAPVTARNYYLEKDFVLTTYDAGPSFYIGNHANATGRQTHVEGVRANPIYEELDFRAIAEKKSGRKLKPSEVSAFWFRQSFEFISDKPFTYLKLLARKVFFFFNTGEIPDNYDFAFMKTLTPVLYLEFVPFGLLMVCALLGIYLYRWSAPAFWLVYIYAGIYAVSVILFYVVSRFRMPVVPALIPVAAFFILDGWKKFIALHGSIRARFMGVSLLAATIVFWPFSGDDNVYARMNIGYAYENKGLWKDAADQYQAAIKARPTMGQAHLRLGVAYRMMGKSDAALEELNLALSTEPARAEIYMEIGIVYENMQSWEQAENHYRTVVQIDPSSAQGHLRLGIALRMMGKLDAALAELRKAAKIEPDLAEPLLETGSVYLVKGLWDEAMAAYEAGLKLKPLKPMEAHLNLGVAYYRKGQVDEAIREHEAAVELNPDSPEAHFNLGTLYALKNDSARSTYHYNKAAELRGHS